MKAFLSLFDWENIRISKLINTIFGMYLFSGLAYAEDVTNCGHILLKEAGKVGVDSVKLPALYSKASVNSETEFMLQVMAIIYVESAFNKYAKSSADAHGLMQMTEIAVKDAVKHCNLRPVSMDNLFDSYTNIKYGTCYLNKLYKEMGGDWDRTLVAYNGGYLQLQKYDRGETIASETANYVLKVRRARKLCK